MSVGAVRKPSSPGPEGIVSDRFDGGRELSDDQTLKAGELQSPARFEELERVVDELNRVTEISNKLLHFELHEKSGRMMVQVVDVKSQEVIREIPPQKVLDVVAKVKEFIGLLLDEKV